MASYVSTNVEMYLSLRGHVPFCGCCTEYCTPPVHSDAASWHHHQPKMRAGRAAQMKQADVNGEVNEL
jgi:hypothetical protein